MTIASRVLARPLEFPPADTHDATVERDIEVPMPDGVKLLTDRYTPRGGGKLPTLLVRSPYGRRGFFGLQSGGQLDPFRNERADGLATIKWVK